MTKSLKSIWDGFTPPGWLPDWRYSDGYTNIKITSKQDFAWEFLRRNPDYQRDYAEINDLCVSEGVQKRYQGALGFNIFSPIAEDAIIESKLFHAKLYRALAKWGLYYYLLDPAYDSSSISNPDMKVYEYCPQEDSDHEVTCHNKYVSMNIKNLHPDLRRRYKLVQDADVKDNIDLNFMGRAGLFNYSVHVVSYEGQYIPTDGGIIPAENEIAYLFDLTLPTKPQIERAKVELVKSQKALFNKKVRQSSVTVELLPTYLRILDADALGVDDKQIGKELFPNKVPFSYSDNKGHSYKNEHHRSPRADALGDARKGAYKLMESNYKLLL